MNHREWSFRRSLLGEMFITLYFPGAGQEVIDWHNGHFREARADRQAWSR